MSRPIALQLYTVRAQLAQDFRGTLEQVAAMGYAGVEMAGLPEGVTAVAARRLLADLGLAICAAHSPLPLGEEGQARLQTMADLGCHTLVCPWLPPQDYQTVDSIRRLCDRLNEAAAVAARHELTLAVHNHWFEFEPVAGTRPYRLWLEWLDPHIQFELDTYWVRVGGVDPLAALAEMGARVPLLHVKDGPADAPASDMMAVGQGVMDYETIIPAAAAAQWLIVELDRCATDMMTAVQASYTYLTEKGLAHGRP